MKKKRICEFSNLPDSLKNVLLAMKICIFIIMVSFMSVSANIYSQDIKFSMELKDVTITKILEEISNKSKFEFLYNNEELKQTELVSIKIFEGGIEQILDICLKGTPLAYQIVDKVIIISPKPKKTDQKSTIIKGKVVDEKGNPLIGATIIIKGTQVGVTTNFEGNFELNITEQKEPVIVVSFIGFENKEIKIDEIKEYKIILKEKKQEIDEVVVTGYYSANKKTYTGSATTITDKEIKQISSKNIFSVLQAIDPSFKIIENNEMGSNPNTLPKFEVRGSGSITGNLKSEFLGDPNMPTFIVDGFEMSVEKLFDLDPDRIESVTILKDASATAIYGSRASNGVVVVELKKPEKGKINVNYNLDYMLTAPDLTDYNVLNAREKLELEVLAGLHETPFSDIYNERLTNICKGYDTYWLNKPLEVGHDLKHSLSLSGGDNSFSYGLNLNYSPQKGVMIGSNRNKYSISNTLSYRNDKVRFTNNIYFDFVESNNSPYGSFDQYVKLNPYYKYKDENGKYLYMLDGSILNPLWNTDLYQVDKAEYNLFTDNFIIDWYITSKLRLNTQASINIKRGSSEQFFSALHTRFGTTSDLSLRGSYNASDSKTMSFQSRATLSYNQSINKHFITGNLIVNYSDDNSKSHGFKAIGFVSEDLSDPSFANGYDENSKPSGNELRSRSAGITGNINYSFNNIYFTDLSFRADISSRFGKDSRWAPFWSWGLGYNMHNEPFMANVSFIDMLKLRGSMGVLGSQNFDPYQSLTKYEYLTGNFYNFYSTGALMMGIGNEDLKWQRSFSENIGLDIGVLKNRLTVTTNYYYKKSTDVLTVVKLAPSLGFNTYMENLGEVVNKGYEVSLRGQLVKRKDLNLSLSVNARSNTNKLQKISNALAEWNKQQDAESRKEIQNLRLNILKDNL